MLNAKQLQELDFATAKAVAESIPPDINTTALAKLFIFLVGYPIKFYGFEFEIL